MPDVFISYSRKDKEFVSRLVASLTSAGRDVWVDWEDIPPSAEWRAEIYTAIREAEAFIFVISPDSSSSAVCREEIEQAVANRKRIIPIVFRPAPRETLVKEIGEYNWIYCREGDSYENALASIYQALDTDLEWVKAHTRLQMRAVEWDQNKRSPSFTLRGEDLATAERTLAGQAGKEPRLTDLQVAYITYSREIQTRNQRRLLIGVSIALAVAIVLSALAIWQAGVATSREQARATQQAIAEANEQIANEREQARATQQAIAESERSRAELQAGLATSGRLAAEGQVDLAGSFPDQAVALALEALDNYPYTSQAEKALADAVQQGRIRAHFPGVKVAHISLDGSRIAIAGADGNLHIIDADSDQELLSIPAADGVALLRWSPDGTRLLALAENGTAMILDPLSGTALASASHPMLSTVKHYVAEWSPDGNRVAQVSNSGERDIISVWSAESGTDLVQLTTAGQDFADADVISLLQDGFDMIGGLAWSPDGNNIITAHPLYGCCGLIIIWDVASGSARQATATGPYGAVAWSRGGAISVAGGQVTGLDIFDPAAGGLQPLLRDEVIHVDSLAWSPDGSYLAYVSPIDDELSVLDTATGRALFTYEGNFRDIFWSERGTLLIYDPQGQTAWLIDARPDTSLAQLPGGYAAAWSPDGRQILVMGSPDVYDLDETLSAHEPQKTAENVLPGLEFFPLGSELSLDWLADNTIAASSWWGRTERMPLGEDSQVALLPLFAENQTIFSPDGSHAVVIGTDSNDVNITGVYTVQGEVLYALAVDARISRGAVWRAAWNPDGARLATSTNTLIHLWEAASGELLATLRGHSGNVSSLSWSPDGARLVSSSGNLDVGASDMFLSGDRTVRVWDVASGQELYRLHAPQDELITNALWSPEGTYLLTTDPGADVTKIWRIWTNLEDLVAYARECCFVRPLSR